jgi:opacity protein-like surface antigen
MLLAVSAAAPAKASADWLFTPYVGYNFGGSATFNDAIGDLEDEFEKRASFGASLSYMGAGAFGFELDFGYAPNFFESTEGTADFDYGDNNLTTVMANVIVGIPVGGTSGKGIRPYAAGGVGIMRSRINDAEDLFGDLSTTDLGFNVGGGVSGFFTDKVGIRGDIRYFRQLRESSVDDDDILGVTVGDLKFWRGSVGVVFRF